MRGQELIDKYIQTGLSDEERFELEKIALDDDFIADAWEGLHEISQSKAQESMARLTQKIDSKQVNTKKEAKIIPMYRKVLKYAAAAAVLTMLVFVFSPKRDMAVLKTETIVVADEVAEADDIGATGLTVTTESPEEEIKEESVQSQEVQSNPTEIRDQTVQNDSHQKKARGRKEKTVESNTVVIDKNLSVAKDEEVLEEGSPQQATPELTIDLQGNANGVAAREVAFQSKINTEANPQQDLSEPIVVEDVEIADESEALGYTVTLKQAEAEEIVVEGVESRKKVTTINQDKSMVVDDKMALAKKETPAGYVDSQSPQPMVGFENYKIQLAENNTITAEELFMHGIKERYLLEVKFIVDEGGIPKDIVIKNLHSPMIVDKVKEQFRNSGPWINVGEKPVLYFLELEALD